jgi:hypothetical protein
MIHLLIALREYTPGMAIAIGCVHPGLIEET